MPIPLNEYKSVENLYRTIHDVKEDKAALREPQNFWKSDLEVSCSPYKALTKTEESEVCGEAVVVPSKQLVTIKTDIQIGPPLDDFSVSYYDESKMREWCSRLDIKKEPVFGK